MDTTKRSIKSKAILAVVVALLGVAIFVPPAFAGNAQYYFDFQKGDRHTCGPANKDYVQQAYISLKPGDTYFVEGSSVFGARLRTYYGDNPATYYYTFRYYGSYRMAYQSGMDVADRLHNLRGMVDDSSGTQWIRIWGYFCP